MEHTENFNLQAGPFRYTQCSCGNGVLKLGGHCIRLNTRTRRDLFEILSKTGEGALTTGSPLPLPVPTWPDKTQWRPPTAGPCAN